jgi:iron-sulfur cluster assembly accessory protein
MITVTESATSKIADLLAENQEPYLRISVKGGGCSGFSYAFDFESKKSEDDFEIDKIVVDYMSMQYLQGATVDFEQKMFESAFKISNPNAKQTCGCGSSFAA